MKRRELKWSGQIAEVWAKTCKDDLKGNRTGKSKKKRESLKGKKLVDILHEWTGLSIAAFQTDK